MYEKKPLKTQQDFSTKQGIAYQNIKQCHSDEYEDKTIQEIGLATPDPCFMKILLVDVDVSCIKITAVFPVHSVPHHVSSTPQPPMMIRGLKQNR